jgi:hypothetical protein
MHMEGTEGTEGAAVGRSMLWTLEITPDYPMYPNYPNYPNYPIVTATRHTHTGLLGDHRPYTTIGHMS